MDDLRSALAGLAGQSRLPGRPPVEHLWQRIRRRRRRRVVTGSVAAGVAAACAVAVLLARPAPGHQPSFRQLELAAFRAGKAVLSRGGGPPVVAYGAIGAERVWVLNGSGLFLSADGGRSFRTITPPVAGSPIGQILAVRFAGPSVGWVLASPNVHPGLVVYRTVDGGRTWTPVPLPAGIAPDGTGAATMSFAGRRDGWIAVQAYVTAHTVRNVLLASTDGGLTWRVASRDIPAPLIEFTGAATGWGLDRGQGRNTLYRTVDGGLTWTAARLPGPVGARGRAGEPGATYVMPFFFGPDGVTIAEPASGRGHPWIETTENGGRTWRGRAAPLPPAPCHRPWGCTVAFAAAGPARWSYWAGAELLSTSDGGRTWQRTIPNVAFDSSAGEAIAVAPGSQYGQPAQPLAFVSAAGGWAIASSGSQSVILRTSDGGRTFAAFRSPGGPGIARPGSVVPG